MGVCAHALDNSHPASINLRPGLYYWMLSKYSGLRGNTVCTHTTQGHVVHVQYIILIGYEAVISMHIEQGECKKFDFPEMTLSKRCGVKTSEKDYA